MADPVLLTDDLEVRTAVAALVRHVLTALAGAGVISGTYSDSTVMIIASAVVGAATVGWSLWQKIQANRKAKA